jgi:hypothetical protein
MVYVLTSLTSIYVLCICVMQAVGFSKVWTRPMPAARVLGEEQQGSSLAMEKVPTIAMAKSI